MITSQLEAELSKNAEALAQTALALARLQSAAADPDASGLVPSLESLAREWLAEGCGYHPLSPGTTPLGAISGTEDHCARLLLRALGIKE
jgi:hypothetical protein